MQIEMEKEREHMKNLELNSSQEESSEGLDSRNSPQKSIIPPRDSKGKKSINKKAHKRTVQKDSLGMSEQIQKGRPNNQKMLSIIGEVSFQNMNDFLKPDGTPIDENQRQSDNVN